MKYLMQTYLFEKVSTFAFQALRKMKKNSEMCWALCYNPIFDSCRGQKARKCSKYQHFLAFNIMISA